MKELEKKYQQQTRWFGIRYNDDLNKDSLLANRDLN